MRPGIGDCFRGGIGSFYENLQFEVLDVDGSMVLLGSMNGHHPRWMLRRDLRNYKRESAQTWVDRAKLLEEARDRFVARLSSLERGSDPPLPLVRWREYSFWHRPRVGDSLLAIEAVVSMYGHTQWPSPKWDAAPKGSLGEIVGILDGMVLVEWVARGFAEVFWSDPERLQARCLMSRGPRAKRRSLRSMAEKGR